ncbi:PfaD family polyunsaturated fatty acid/polyketide biosynthesis protein [Saccharopolyspora sp. WRP15-2]|uniref:PfaD family polyunsaturated fatty acid/polyketide biosynthesis protein n=1 Tax=Saccharopolyspora oryzae TaxID=2997343 RepID=A0ABT4V5B0_9PSEU|nr:PfaD family polyunsaturated fatty acid/polyketide biosynthesis protein [Saccharopolyspora oryzae]MDA3629150.1 PfaD family polyunsaturated fatty acid/polyketide biosynthesis protein [Saccharopolyspora oryzae]
MSITANGSAAVHPVHGVRTEPDGIRGVLNRLESPCFAVETERGIGVTNEQPQPGARILAAVGPLPPQRLGSARFRAHHGVSFACMSGAMANGVASEELVIAMARAGFLGSFGSAGLLPDRIDTAQRRFAREIPGKPFAANQIHSPSEDALERGTVELYLQHGVRCVEASAFMDLTPSIVRYRLAGLARGDRGEPVVANRVIAKVSRPEVAAKFMRPAPEKLVSALLREGLITAEQAEWSRTVPMADDITVEADSGGHTDRRPLSALFPVIAGLRDEVCREYRRPVEIRVGAAGGIGTPEAISAALSLGADYVVTGSVNQSCVESGISPAARELLAAATISDCEMAPAADMFELGVDVQTLKKGTMFPMRARRLYELYRTCGGLDEIPDEERNRLEKQVFRRSFDEIWSDVVGFFDSRDPAQVQRAADDPKRRMALVFRWYLGMSSAWATGGQPDRTIDYQIWCGPAMGAFNDWVRGSHLEPAVDRHVADVSQQLMRGAAFAERVHQLGVSGIRLPNSCTRYRPLPGGAR